MRPSDEAVVSDGKVGVRQRGSHKVRAEVDVKVALSSSQLHIVGSDVVNIYFESVLHYDGNAECLRKSGVVFYLSHVNKHTPGYTLVNAATIDNRLIPHVNQICRFHGSKQTMEQCTLTLHTSRSYMASYQYHLISLRAPYLVF